MNSNNLIYDRTERLIGSTSMEKLKASKVLVVGLGGVGGYIAEALARAGVGKLGLCDFDIVDPSNLNRQLISTIDVIGQKKTLACQNRLKSINNELQIETFDFRLNIENITDLRIYEWDFVADAIDDTKAKFGLIKACYENGVKIISSMGTGNKLDPFSYKIVPIKKTEVDPLAKSMRKKLKEIGITDLPVLYSTESPKTEVLSGNPIPSISYMPAVAGLEIASYIIQNILK